MLIPQFTLRWLLALTSVCGVFFLIVSFAARGHAWAVGVSLGAVSLASILLLHAGAFFFLWLFSLLVPAGRKKALVTGSGGLSPFKSPPKAGGNTPSSAV